MTYALSRFRNYWGVENKKWMTETFIFIFACVCVHTHKYKKEEKKVAKQQGYWLWTEWIYWCLQSSPDEAFNRFAFQSSSSPSVEYKKKKQQKNPQKCPKRNFAFGNFWYIFWSLPSMPCKTWLEARKPAGSDRMQIS